MINILLYRLTLKKPFKNLFFFLFTIEDSVWVWVLNNLKYTFLLTSILTIRTHFRVQTGYIFRFRSRSLIKKKKKIYSHSQLQLSQVRVVWRFGKYCLTKTHILCGIYEYFSIMWTNVCFSRGKSLSINWLKPNT